MCGREDSRQSDPRARCRARLPCRQGDSGRSGGHPDVCRPGAPAGLSEAHGDSCHPVAVLHAAVLAPKTLTRLCLPKGKKGYICFEQ